jgi:histidine ammonia-lyase
VVALDGADVIALDGGGITAGEIAAIARREASVAVTPLARARVAASHEFAVRVSAERPVYGRTTGVGANRNEQVVDPVEHAHALLRSHATSAGPLRSPERVRAMLAVRLVQLAAGGSGASPAVLDGLVAMLDADALPPIRELGSIGTGDLSALATTALALSGERPTSNPLPFRVALGVDDALPFLSSNAATIGDAALALVDVRRCAYATVVIAALTFTAVDGNAEAFAEALERVTPFAGATWVAQQMRALVNPASAPARIQDSFGLRALPQVHGSLIDALARLDDVVTAMANAPSENPVALPGVGLAHHGGFHAAYLVQALDSALAALAQSAQLTLARISVLNEPANTTLPAFLSDGTPGASGVMVIEYVAASALGTLRGLAVPGGVQSVTLSRGVEEDASFASLAARGALTAAQTYRTLVACELVAAVRAVRMRRDRDRGRDYGRALASVLELCGGLDDALVDRDLTPDIEIADALVDALAEVLERSLL